MTTVHIRQATPQDIPTIQAMAEVVFRTTYAEILSPEQMDYMMEWMYGAESLIEQITGEGKEFFVAEEADGTACGYISVEHESRLPDGRPLLHLQKIYVMPQYQGRGLGKQLFSFLTQRLGTQHSDGYRLELNVNRHNRAVGFYEAMGMQRDREGDFPIGNGYYMNDYIYALEAVPVAQPTGHAAPEKRETIL
ncbi:MAG: GNAT family N-acetyltransferase [Bacteroidaceae bacterium]|nr:GNAT family N-acetyltransferase [Bacteroidaceae bacterium]